MPPLDEHKQKSGGLMTLVDIFYALVVHSRSKANDNLLIQTSLNI